MNTSAGYSSFNVSNGSSFIAYNNTLLDETNGVGNNNDYSFNIYGFANLT